MNYDPISMSNCYKLTESIKFDDIFDSLINHCMNHNKNAFGKIINRRYTNILQ